MYVCMYVCKRPSVKLRRCDCRRICMCMHVCMYVNVIPEALWVRLQHCIHTCSIYTCVYYIHKFCIYTCIYVCILVMKVAISERKNKENPTLCVCACMYVCMYLFWG
jgi:hypothetical protein